MHSSRLKNRTALYALAIFLYATVAAAAQKPPQLRPVQIDSGKLQGVLTTDLKVIAYKGIPYAAPPIGELRWRPPQPVSRWKGVLFARDFGPHCIQSGSWNDMVFHDPGPSEDCLTLNVWVPVASTAKPAPKHPAPLPVMVWIYGGGFTTGGTSENRQDGQFLAHRGVIVVSMNYRLGVFGFMALLELTEESANHASGNYGLMDQTAAIAWVRRNIAAFGGDPANITIFGESAGSQSVSAQIASPIAKGLFAKAIGESGAIFSSFSMTLPSRQQAEQADAAWAERAFGSSKLFYLRTLTADDLLAKAMARTGQTPRFQPDIDGFFLPDSVPHIYAAGQQAHIPVLGGWNANESRANGKPTAASFTAQAQQEFGADAPSFLAVYPATSDAEALQSANDYAGDRFIAFSTWAWLEAQARTGAAPVYRYFLDLGSPGDRNHTVAQGAFHSDDIEYIFGTLDSRPEMALRPEDRTLSEQMGEYWTNFAKSKTGDPNGPGLPRWLPYNAADDWQVLHLDATPASKADNLRGRDLFLDSQWGRAAGK
jgi:para-nitrobenzyl esterase